MNDSMVFGDGSFLPEDCHSPLPGTGTKRKSGRRSWFTPNKSIRLEIAVDPREPKATKIDEQSEVEELTLSHFTKPPKVS